ncbi:hypothetical protein [Roseomonas sp. USHLN139]|uniref:hypothetical protein n=1 Tax=Roseomonas sp. USHLN139 TaxID=3081298 RepID=UPI003B01F050
MQPPLKPLTSPALCFAVSDLVPLLPDLRNAAGHAQAEAIKVQEAAYLLRRQADAQTVTRFLGCLHAGWEAALRPEEAQLLQQADICAKNAESARSRAARLTAIIRTVEAIPCS